MKRMMLRIHVTLKIFFRILSLLIMVSCGNELPKQSLQRVEAFLYYSMDEVRGGYSMLACVPAKEGEQQASI